MGYQGLLWQYPVCLLTVLSNYDIYYEIYGFSKLTIAVSSMIVDSVVKL